MAAAWLLCLIVPGLAAETPVVFSGMCDASAAALLEGGSLMMVADDEVNELRVYSVDQPGLPVQQTSLNELLGIVTSEDESFELDIECVARIGDRFYWMTSHGRNKSGATRPSRQFFFALNITRKDGQISTTLVGRPYRDLLSHIATNPALRALKIDAAIRLGDKKDKVLAPKEKGFNIEGLCETRDGQTLLIGLRNPRPRGKALLIPFINPDAVVSQQASPEFGMPILLDLSVQSEGKTVSLGIRSLAYVASKDYYLIVAGPPDAGGPFAVFRWSGQVTSRPQLVKGPTLAISQIPEFSPEALIVHPGDAKFQMLSDDGSLKVPVLSPEECQKGAFKDGRCEAKYLLDDQRKTFRSLTVTLD
jgi:hypothetical protein